MSAGYLLRHYREMCSYSMRKAAKILKMDSGNLSKYENGKLVIPLKLVSRIHKEFKLDCDELNEFVEQIKGDLLEHEAKRIEKSIVKFLEKLK